MSTERKTHSFIVTVTAERCTQADARSYISDAIWSWGGGFRPDNPFFGLCRRDVKVEPIRKPRKP